MTTTFQGKTALITGASSGFGKEFAHVFAREGYDLLLIAKPDNALSETAEEIKAAYPVTVDTLGTDLTKPDAGKTVYDWACTNGRVISCLVNNVGVGNYGKFSVIPLEKERELLDLNISILTELCHRFIPHMKEHGGGKILNVASLAAFQPGPYYATYFASKAYVLMFSEALTYELKDDHIVVVALCPGPSPTNFFKHAEMSSDSKFLRSTMMSPRDIAELGYKGLIKGKAVIVPNKLRIVPASARFLPRFILARISKHLVEISAKG